jgi:hypothetical protein
MPPLTRREMMKLTALAMNAPTLTHLNAATATKPMPVSGKPEDVWHWIRYNRTLIAEAYNPPFYPSLDYVPAKAVEIAKTLDCDSMRYPAASYYAYFPTKSGYPVHPELKGDPMKESLELLRKAGLRTVSYVPLCHPFMAVDANNPNYLEWCRRSAEGEPYITKHYGFNRYYEGCLNGPIRDIARTLTTEVLEYDFDVMYFDGPYEGMNNDHEFCYCKWCKAAYQKRFGRDIPDQEKSPLKDRIQYTEWMRDEVVMGFFQEIRELVHKKGKPILFNDTGLLTKTEWRGHCVPVADGFMYEAAETPEDKLFNLQLGLGTDKVIWTYVGHHTLYNREHIKNTDGRGWFTYPVEQEELLLDGATATAAGVGCVYWGLSRFFYAEKPPLEYTSGQEVKRIFDFQQKHHALLKTLKPRPQVGVLVNSQTIDWYTSKSFIHGAYANYYHGAFNLLKSLSVESEPFLDWLMTPEVLARYELVYLPNAVSLSDAQCDMLRKYVQGGGVLVATHLTSAADEYGRVRKDYGLADVFGASFTTPDPYEYPDLYLKPVGGGEFLPQDMQIMRFKPTTGKVLATTWDRGNRRDLGPAIVTNNVGKGQCIYIGSGLEAVYEETRMLSVRGALAKLLLPHLESGRSYQLEFVQGVTPHYMAADKDIVLHLLANVGDRNLHTKSRVKFAAVEGMTAKLRVKGAVKSVRLLVSGAAPVTQREGEWLTVHVPRVDIYEAIHVEMA